MDFKRNIELNAEQEAFLRSCTPAQLLDQRYAASMMAELGSEPEVRQLESSLSMARSKEQTIPIIRRLLEIAGTNIDRNEMDPYGDGDQTLLSGKKLEGKRQILRNLFAAGGDIEFHLREDVGGLTSFAYDCIKGDREAVERRLDAASLEGPRALIKLMEYRQTSMRLSPFLLTVAMSKHKRTVGHYSNRAVEDMDHIGVVRALIRHGTRPDAKDVIGKTVCHYGAGVMATDETLEMTEMALKACNLKVSMGTRTNLIDMRDRVGSISMHEVAMSQRDDVAKFLCKRSKTCLDVADGAGISIRQMMCTSVPAPNKVMSVLKKYTAKQEDAKRRCENCDKQGKLLDCSRCFSVAYCGKKCQISHWKSKHKKDCKQMREKGELVLGQPMKIGKGYTSFCVGAKGYTENYRYGLPDGLKEDGEPFWIKVQSNGIQHDLLIYDETRTCNFSLPPGENGHRELVEKISQDRAFLGRKSFFKARFDEKGRCVVHLRSLAALKW